MRIPDVRRIKRNQEPDEAFPGGRGSILETRRTQAGSGQAPGLGSGRTFPEVARFQTTQEPAPAPVRREAAPSSPAIGWQKHITFGGRTAGGVNIPGGLRMPVAPERSVRPTPAGNQVVRPAPEPVGWDRNITFGGRTAGGVNIPGGLRAPVHKEAG
ncbi:MAG TPA: hypothetical protein VHL54_13190 [Actinomycetota bacterium]|nr:hypothetical protein [Actinomycetota bacterium]